MNQPPNLKRVLIVDDNLDSAEMLAEIIASWGHEARHVADGPSALRAVTEDPPDIVLLDIGLPGMSGYEVAEHLRALPLESRLRIVALSGYGQREDFEKSAAAGFDEHLVKPVDFEKLARTLSSGP